MKTEVTSREFDADYNTRADWSGVQIDRGQSIRRWKINGEESYEPTALTDVINGLEDGRSGKVQNSDHALRLVEQHGHKNVFFVTQVNRDSITKNRRKGSWSDGEFRTYIGQHAKFYILHERVEVRDEKQIIRDLIARTAEDQFITASGLNPIEWGVDEIERDLDGCARELYEDYEGKKHIEDLDEARELLRDWRDKHK